VADVIKNKVVWQANEFIYKIDSAPNGIFIILDGAVNIYARDGLLLNTLGEKELLGETSTILNNKRSVTAQAGSKGASAVYLNKKDFEAALKINTSLKAIIEKTQLRLIESNKQSAELSNLLNKIMININAGETAIKDVKKLLSVASKKITLMVNSNLD
jgi:CRP-like cAMP-binding protein